MVKTRKYRNRKTIKSKHKSKFRKTQRGGGLRDKLLENPEDQTFQPDKKPYGPKLKRFDAFASRINELTTFGPKTEIRFSPTELTCNIDYVCIDWKKAINHDYSCKRISSNNENKIINHVKKYESTLQHVSLRNHWNNLDITFILRYLTNSNSTLESLDLRGTEIPNKGQQTLARNLVSYQSLKTLFLSYPNWNDSQRKLTMINMFDMSKNEFPWHKLGNLEQLAVHITNLSNISPAFFELNLTDLLLRVTEVTGTQYTDVMYINYHGDRLPLWQIIAISVPLGSLYPKDFERNWSTYDKIRSYNTTYGVPRKLTEI